MTKHDDEIAALRAEVAALKDAVKPAPAVDPREAERRDAEWMDQMHQMRERRMNFASNFHPDDLRAMEAAAPTSVVKEIALRDARAPTSPSSAGTSGQVTRVSSNPGILGSNTTGWVEPRPLSNPPGVQ